MAGISGILGSEDDDPFGGAEAPGGASYKPFSFSAKGFTLSTLVEHAGRVVPTRDFIPALRNFRVSVSPGSLRVAGTNMEQWVISTTPSVTLDGDDAVVLLPAARLQEILRATSGSADILITGEGDHATVTAGAGSWTLMLADDADYPDLPDVSGVEFTPVGRVALLDAIRAVKYAVSKEGGRQPLMLVNVVAQPNGSATVTACDHTRFARTVLPGFTRSIQIPLAALDHLLRLLADSGLEQVEVGETDGSLVFKVSGDTFVTRNLRARFPDVEKLLLEPTANNRDVLTVDRVQLTEAVKRVRINADTSTSAIGLRLAASAITVLARDMTGNTAEETLTAGWSGADGRLVVVNWKFLTDMLAAHPAESCRFLLGEPKAKRMPLVLLKDEATGTIGIIQQMAAKLVGYES